MVLYFKEETLYKMQERSTPTPMTTFFTKSSGVYAEEIKASGAKNTVTKKTYVDIFSSKFFPPVFTSDSFILLGNLFVAFLTSKELS